MIAQALAYPMRGHRKIAWLCRHDGSDVTDSTCLRVQREAGLVLPIDNVRERRDLSNARRKAFVQPVGRRDVAIGGVIDYWAKYVLAAQSPRRRDRPRRRHLAAAISARCGAPINSCPEGQVAPAGRRSVGHGAFPTAPTSDGFH